MARINGVKISFRHTYDIDYEHIQISFEESDGGIIVGGIVNDYNNLIDEANAVNTYIDEVLNFWFN